MKSPAIKQCDAASRGAQTAFRVAIEIYLERHDFQVTIADGGEAGLRALEGAAYDLMIVDIFMPRMRGFESIRIFHERRRRFR